MPSWLRRPERTRSLPLERRHVERILGEIEAPHARKNFGKALRGLIAARQPAGLCDRDPTTGIRVRVPMTCGFRAWFEDHIAQFEGVI
jgi:hypothetical protein